jgi:hypothetical protein
LPVDVLVVPSEHVVVFAVFCTPPWPLHVPLPVDVLVVPSLHVVGVAAASAASARPAVASADNANGNASVKARIVVFTSASPFEVN